MTVAEVLLTDYDTEISNTRRTLERIPETLFAYTPHAKSMPLGKLAMHCAIMPLFGLYIIEDPGMDMMAPTRPHTPLVWESTAHCLAQLDLYAPQCRAAIAAASDEHLLALWPFAVGPNVISNFSRLKSMRLWCINHLVHHTAQIGIYLRLNDIAIPGLYGPSADEQFIPQ